MVPAIIEASHEMQAEAVAGLVDGMARRFLGVSSVEIYLADYQQGSLLPVEVDRELEGFLIDRTAGGRAFVSGDVVEVQLTDSRCLWVPIVDGTERVGVLAITIPHGVDVPTQACSALAGVTAELIITKGQYSDVFFLARRQRDMALAAEMQWHLLPPLTYITPRVAVAAALEPAYEVGGDAFDYALNGDTLHIAMVDAMGHGVRASLMTSAAIGSYRHCRRAGSDLVETFEAMDHIVGMQFVDSFVTAQIAQLDCESGLLVWLNGGHPRPLLVRHNKVVGQLECEPTLPAGFSGGVAALAQHQLEPGDSVVFFTDGIIESRHDREQFGTDRFSDFLERELLSGHKPPEMMRRLTRAVLEHNEGKLQDDATLLMVNWKGTSA